MTPLQRLNLNIRQITQGADERRPQIFDTVAWRSQEPLRRCTEGQTVEASKDDLVQGDE